MEARDWIVIKEAAERVRDRLQLPLFILCLVLACFAAGTARAVYILAAAIICISFVRWSQVNVKIAGLAAALGEVEAKLNARSNQLEIQLQEVDVKVVAVTEDLGALREQFIEFREAPPVKSSSINVGFLATIVFVVFLSNFAVWVLGRNTLADCGDQIGALIARVDVLERVLPKARLDVGDRVNLPPRSISRIANRTQALMATDGDNFKSALASSSSQSVSLPVTISPSVAPTGPVEAEAEYRSQGKLFFRLAPGKEADAVGSPVRSMTGEHSQLERQAAADGRNGAESSARRLIKSDGEGRYIQEVSGAPLGVGTRSTASSVESSSLAPFRSYRAAD